MQIAAHDVFHVAHHQHRCFLVRRVTVAQLPVPVIAYAVDRAVVLEKHGELVTARHLLNTRHHSVRMIVIVRGVPCAQLTLVVVSETVRLPIGRHDHAVVGADGHAHHVVTLQDSLRRSEVLIVVEVPQLVVVVASGSEELRINHRLHVGELGADVSRRVGRVHRHDANVVAVQLVHGYRNGGGHLRVRVHVCQGPLDLLHRVARNAHALVAHPRGAGVVLRHDQILRRGHRGEEVPVCEGHHVERVGDPVHGPYGPLHRDRVVHPLVQRRNHRVRFGGGRSRGACGHFVQVVRNDGVGAGGVHNNVHVHLTDAIERHYRTVHVHQAAQLYRESRLGCVDCFMNGGVIHSYRVRPAQRLVRGSVHLETHSRALWAHNVQLHLHLTAVFEGRVDP